jgi:hypothetical protein
VSHYGLAARGPGFEKAAAAVAMPELADEADARSRFAEWIATTAERPTGEVGPSTDSGAFEEFVGRLGCVKALVEGVDCIKGFERCVDKCCAAIIFRWC